jgi:molybdate transport system substrate-binding protein
LTAKLSLGRIKRLEIYVVLLHKVPPMKRFLHCRGHIAQPWLILSGMLIAIILLVLGLRQLTHPASTAAKSNALVLLCAAGPLKPVQEICAEYERECGVKVSIEADNSGRLLSRLRIAPQSADLYLASDESFIRDAQREKLVTDAMPVVRQHAVVGVAKGNPRRIHSLDDLLKDDVRVVLPSPKLAAVAESVERALEGTGRWQALVERQRSAAARVSTVGNVTEAAQAVKIGAADATFVWDATARQFGLDAVELPELQSRTQESAVLGLVSASPRQTAALLLSRYLRARDRGQKVFAKYHYQTLENAGPWIDWQDPQ